MHGPLRFAVAMVVVTALTHAPPCSADDAVHARAVDLFERSEVAYQRGRFAEAVALLRASFDLEREPVLLYNLGRAYEGLGDLPAAARAYEEFLARQPDAPDRGAIEQRIATLRRQQAEREHLERRATAPPAARTSAHLAPWILTGIGVAGIAAGGVTGLLARDRNDEAAHESTYREADRKHVQAESLATVANVCFIAGAAVVLVGVVWGIVDLSARSGKSASSGAGWSF